MENWCPEDEGHVFVGELGIAGSRYVFIGVLCATVDAWAAWAAWAAVSVMWEKAIKVAIRVAAKFGVLGGCFFISLHPSLRFVLCFDGLRSGN